MYIIQLYLYGSDATAYKTSMKIKTQAEADIAKLRQKVVAAECQMPQPLASSDALQGQNGP